MKVYKYRSVNDKEILNRDINSFKKNQFYAPNFKSLNDKFEANFDEIISNVINILGKVFSADTSELEKNITEIISYKEKLGIFCLSKNRFSETLWAYYSNDNKGYCIQYDLDKLEGKIINRDFSTLLDVQYSDEKPVITIPDIQNGKLITKMFATKKKRWEHEEEIRLIFDTVGFKEHHESAITAIYFGCDANDEFIEQIKSEFINRDIVFYKIIANSQTNEFEEEIIGQSFKTYKQNINSFNFSIAKMIENTANSYYIHIKENYELEDLQQLAIAFKERYFYKPSNIYFINNLEVLDIIEKYPKNDHEYLKFADSVVADFPHDSSEIYQYPFKDFRYYKITKN